jgi:glucose-6-phosphate-specific signal transduction histidine kinase
LGDWQLVPLLQSYLDQWAAFLSRLPEGAVFAALLLPIVLGIFSKRVIVPLGCVLLAAMALCAVAAPASIAVTLATGAYFGGLIVAVAGLRARRTAGALQAELANLRADVDRLLSAEERHYLTQLRSSTEEKQR